MTAQGPLKKAETLTPEVKALVFSGKKIWHDGPFACHYADDAFTIVLGMVTKTGSGWDAYDMQNTNASQTGPYSIGHFIEEKGARGAMDRAKQAVEEYWSVIG